MKAPPTTESGVYIDFVSTYFGKLYGTAYELCRNWALAEDMVQETLIRMLKVYLSGDVDKLNIGYAKRTLVNLGNDHFRAEAARRRMTEKVERSAVEQLANDPGDQVNSDAYLVWLQEGLTPRQQEILFWRNRGIPMVEVAEHLGISPATGHRYMKMALDELKRRIS